MPVERQFDHPSSQPPAPQRVVAVVNPSKEDADVARDTIVVACRKAGWSDPVLLATEVEDPGTSMARRALELEADVVLAAGGDGTVRTVAEVLSGTGTPLGLIPLGTGNLLARNLSATLGDIHHSADVALFGDQRLIDMVEVTLTSADGQESTHQLCVMGGAGFDAEIMEHTNDELKKRIGWMAYGEAGMRRLMTSPAWTRYRMDDGPWQTRRLRSIMAANCGTLTGGLELIPNAKLDDGRLDVVVIAPRGPLGWVNVAAKLLVKHRHELPDMDLHTCHRLEAEFHTPTVAEMDGDSAGKITRMTAEIRPKALALRVPPSQADDAEDPLTA